MKSARILGLVSMLFPLLLAQGARANGAVPLIAASELAAGAALANLGFTPLRPGNNLSDLANPATARANLGLGPLQSGYNATAGLGSMANGNFSAAASPANNWSWLGGPSTIIDFHTAPPASFGAISGGPAVFDICNPTGCLTGPYIIAKNVSTLTSTLNEQQQEINQEFNAVFKTGQVLNWTVSTGFVSGKHVFTGNNAPFGAVYTETVASCTSASSGLGPSGTGTGITDGTCVWNFEQQGIQGGGKSNLSVSTDVQPGANSSWSLVGDFQVEAGVGNIPSAYGQEFDCTNLNSDSYAGAPFGMNCLVFGGQGGSSYPMLSWIYFNSGAGYGAHYGLLFNSANVVKDADFADATSVGVVVQALGGHNHGAMIEDDSSSLTVIHTGSSGAHINGVDLTAGTFSGNPFMSTGFSVGNTGFVNGAGYTTRAGNGAADGTDHFNINWTGSYVDAWIDLTDIGHIAFMNRSDAWSGTPNLSQGFTVGSNASMSPAGVFSAASVTSGTVLHQSLSYNSNGILAANTTQYFLSNMTGTENAAAAPVARPGTFKNLYIAQNTSPGASYSIVYTLRVNRASTGVTCAVTGSASSCNDTTDTATIAAGQSFDIMAVSPAGANGTIPAVGIEFDN